MESLGLARKPQAGRKDPGEEYSHRCAKNSKSAVVLRSEDLTKSPSACKREDTTGKSAVPSDLIRDPSRH